MNHISGQVSNMPFVELLQLVVFIKFVFGWRS